MIFAGQKGGGSSGGHIAADTLFSDSTLTVLDLISEGQIGGLVNGAKSVFFDDIPLQNTDGTYNYNDVRLDWVNGTPDQKVINGFDEVVSSRSVNARVKKGSPVTISIIDPEVTKVRCVVNIPMLSYTDSKGNISGTSVYFRFEISVNGGKFRSQGDICINGKSRSQYQRAYKYNLPGTDDSGKNKAVN